MWRAEPVGNRPRFASPVNPPDTRRLAGRRRCLRRLATCDVREGVDEIGDRPEVDPSVRLSGRSPSRCGRPW